MTRPVLWCRICRVALKRRFIERIAPLLILFAAYLIAWIDLFLPQPPLRLFSSPWFAFSAAKNIARFAFVALVAKRWLGMKALGLETSALRPKDIVDGILIAAAAGSLALGLAALALLVGAQNSLLSSFSGGTRGPLAYILMGASSLTIGYSEELFFRFFTVEALERSGFSASAAIFVSALIFGGSHGSQGIFGMIAAALLALLFSSFRTKGKGLHALALGHAIYDFAILLAVI